MTTKTKTEYQTDENGLRYYIDKKYSAKAYFPVLKIGNLGLHIISTPTTPKKYIFVGSVPSDMMSNRVFPSVSLALDYIKQSGHVPYSWMDK